MASVKINISIDDELLKKIDECAEDNYCSRSGIISIATSEYVKSKELVKAITSMSVSMGRIASSGNIDDETMKELETFQSICNMLASASAR